MCCLIWMFSYFYKNYSCRISTAWVQVWQVLMVFFQKKIVLFLSFILEKWLKLKLKHIFHVWIPYDIKFSKLFINWVFCVKFCNQHNILPYSPIILSSVSHVVVLFWRTNRVNDITLAITTSNSLGNVYFDSTVCLPRLYTISQEMFRWRTITAANSSKTLQTVISTKRWTCEVQQLKII